MKIAKFLFLFLASILSFNSCGSLLPVTITQKESFDSYKYFYITPTSSINSTSGYTTGSTYIYGATYSKSVNPTNIISGYLIKKGFIGLADIKPELASETFIVNFGIGDKRPYWLGYTIEVIIQFISAKTNTPICVCSGEGFGETEADDITIAINRCLDTVFSK